MKKLLLLFLLIVAASAAAPGFLGMQAERRYEALVAQLEDAGYRVTDRHYARGWFSADARLQFELPSPEQTGGEAAPPVVLVKTHVVHGPFLGDPAPPFGLARLDSEVWLGEAPVVVRDGESEAPLQTRIGFLGATHAAIRVPPRQIALAEGTVEIAAVVGEFAFGAGDGIAVGSVSMPSVRLQGSDGSGGELGGLSLDVDFRRGPAGLPVGGWRFVLQRLTVDAPEAQGFALDLLEIVVGTAERDGSIDATADYRVRSLTAEDERYGPFDMRFAITGLPPDALAQVQAAAEEAATLAATAEERGQAVAVALLANADALLANDPAIALERFTLDTPQGRVDASLTLQAVGLRAAQLRDPQGALSRIEGRAAVRVPETLLAAMLRQQARQQLARNAQAEEDDTPAPAAEAIEAAAAQHATQQIESLVTQQLLTREGETLVLAALLRNGLLTVNGKTIPLTRPAPSAVP